MSDEEKTQDKNNVLNDVDRVHTSEQDNAANTQGQILIPEVEPLTMEVHHHGHVHEQKKWKEYLFQFLMLFLAVFCGFLAENEREHFIENGREKKYIKSMISDLAEDTTNIEETLIYNIKKFHGLDTLSNALNNFHFSDTAQLQLFKLKARYASNMGEVVINDRTIRQLLSSGNMRLIQQLKVSDSIMQYYGQAKEALTGQAGIYEETMKRVVFFSEDIFDNMYEKLNLNNDYSFTRNMQWDKSKLLTSDIAILKKYARMIVTAQGVIAYYITLLQEMKTRSVSLLLFLKKEYQ
jgi:hypothetical protein